MTIELTGDPVTGAALHNFECSYATSIEHTASYVSQGSITYVIENPVIRMPASAAPISATPTGTAGVFAIEDIPVEYEGTIRILSTSGAVSGALPVTVMDLAQLTFPLASGTLDVRPDPNTGDVTPTLEFELGTPFQLPGGRLDIGSGFIVGVGGTADITLDDAECDAPDCPADVNGDGAVTPTDFNAWINAFNNNLPGCDQNNDAQCTPTDFNAWIQNFNIGCP